MSARMLVIVAAALVCCQETSAQTTSSSSKRSQSTVRVGGGGQVRNQGVPAGGRFTRSFRPAPAPSIPPSGEPSSLPSTHPGGDSERDGIHQFPYIPRPDDGAGSGPGSGAGSPETGGPGNQRPFRNWWGDERFPVEIPIYAPLYGVTPGYFPTRYPRPSTASVTIHRGPAKTRFSAKSRFVFEIDRAVEELHHHPLAADPMKQGVMSFRDRDYYGAADSFRRAAPLDPDNGLPRFGLALAQFALGDYEGAAWSMRRGLDLLPDWARSGQDLGAWYATGADFEDHIMALRSHCRVRPDDMEAKAVLGYIAFFTGDTAGARTAFLAVRTVRPSDPLPAHFLEELGRIGDG